MHAIISQDGNSGLIQRLLVSVHRHSVQRLTHVSISEEGQCVQYGNVLLCADLHDPWFGGCEQSCWTNWPTRGRKVHPRYGVFLSLK